MRVTTKVELKLFDHVKRRYINMLNKYLKNMIRLDMTHTHTQFCEYTKMRLIVED